MFDYLDAARFWSKVEVKGVNECWPFSACKGAFGHGQVHFRGASTGAHRVAYMLAFGEVPCELIVRHKCDNPECCNPRHLETGTTLDNVRDRVLRRRGATGQRNGRSKLTVKDVHEIRVATCTVTELAKLFGVDRKVIRDIKAGKTWRDV